MDEIDEQVRERIRAEIVLERVEMIMNKDHSEWDNVFERDNGDAGGSETTGDESDGKVFALFWEHEDVAKKMKSGEEMVEASVAKAKKRVRKRPRVSLQKNEMSGGKNAYKEKLSKVLYAFLERLKTVLEKKEFASAQDTPKKPSKNVSADVVMKDLSSESELDFWSQFATLQELSEQARYCNPEVCINDVYKLAEVEKTYSPEICSLIARHAQLLQDQLPSALDILAPCARQREAARAYMDSITSDTVEAAPQSIYPEYVDLGNVRMKTHHDIVEEEESSMSPYTGAVTRGGVFYFDNLLLQHAMVVIRIHKMREKIIKSIRDKRRKERDNNGKQDHAFPKLAAPLTSPRAIPTRQVPPFRFAKYAEVAKKAGPSYCIQMYPEDRPGSSVLEQGPREIAMIRASVAVMLIHSGYTSVEEDGLAVLCDAVGNVIRKVGRSLNLSKKRNYNDPKVEMHERYRPQDPTELARQVSYADFRGDFPQLYSYAIVDVRKMFNEARNVEHKMKQKMMSYGINAADATENQAAKAIENVRNETLIASNANVAKKSSENDQEACEQNKMEVEGKETEQQKSTQGIEGPADRTIKTEVADDNGEQGADRSNPANTSSKVEIVATTGLSIVNGQHAAKPADDTEEVESSEVEKITDASNNMEDVVMSKDEDVEKTNSSDQEKAKDPGEPQGINQNAPAPNGNQKDSSAGEKTSEDETVPEYAFDERARLFGLFDDAAQLEVLKDVWIPTSIIDDVLRERQPLVAKSEG